MIKINQLKLRITHSEQELINKIKKELRLTKGEQFTYRIVKRSIDARKKPDLFYVYTVTVKIKNEETVVKRANNKSLTIGKDNSYQVPMVKTNEMFERPIVIGAGPAGLFCAYILAQAGFEPIVIERGKTVEERAADVEAFWETGVLDPNSNVQFGEGGAGTFSDGKLNTAVKDAKGRISYVLETFVKYGANPEICFDNKPHIGTDVLFEVIRNLRKDLVEMGTTFHFETRVNEFLIDNGKIRGVVGNKHFFYSPIVVLAIGHSARDTFLRLHEKKVPMEAKQFAVGFRVEHPQSMIDEAMYGMKRPTYLQASPYKVTANFPNGRGVYSFCMCPGGYVVNASSGENQAVVNGMSYSKRDSENANSAIIVSVGPDDFGSSHPLAGMKYQEQLEAKAFALAKGKVPQQLFGDYCENKVSAQYGAFSSCVKGQTAFANLRGLLSEEMETSFMDGMQHFDKIIPGFARKDAILSGIESRTSSPVRILRSEEFESEIKGIFPCGEGAGYAGGITSAAVDGMKVAEAIIAKYSNLE